MRFLGARERLDPARPNAKHAGYIDDAVLRVPWLMVHPELIPAGSKVSSNVGLSDVAPTILDLIDVPVPAEFAGRSVRSAIMGETLEPMSTSFETLFFQLENPQGVARFGSRSGKYKYVMRVQRPGEPNEQIREHLFDTPKDPLEQHNLLSTGKLNKELRTLVGDLRRQTVEYRAKKRRADDLILDDSSMEKLRSLGYLGGD